MQILLISTLNKEGYGPSTSSIIMQIILQYSTIPYMSKKTRNHKISDLFCLC